MLEQLPLEPWTARRRDELLQLLDEFDGYCERLDQAVQPLAQENPQARRLMSHPGIGSVISLAYVLTLGDVSRFQNSRQVVSLHSASQQAQPKRPRSKLGSLHCESWCSPGPNRWWMEPDGFHRA